MIHNITEYRKAKIIVKDLERILKILEAAETSLRAYDKYRPVQYILTTMVSEKNILKVYLESHRLIIDNKGLTRK